MVSLLGIALKLTILILIHNDSSLSLENNIYEDFEIYFKSDNYKVSEILKTFLPNAIVLIFSVTIMIIQFSKIYSYYII